MSAAAAATNLSQPATTPKIGGASALSMPPMYLNKKTLNHILLLFLVVGIAFVQNVPPDLRQLSRGLLGSSISIGLTYITYTYFNWPTALMFALFILLCMSVAPPKQSYESFVPNVDTTHFVGSKQKWYVEKILGENPLFIEEETVKTMAVQDTNSGRSRSGHN